MGRVYYNKLVRDRSKEKKVANGEACSVRVITDAQEFRQELFKKVSEEASALARSRTREEFLSAYANVMAVLDALTKDMEFSAADISTALTENVAKKGLYERRHFLHWSEDGGYESNETPRGVAL